MVNLRPHEMAILWTLTVSLRISLKETETQKPLVNKTATLRSVKFDYGSVMPAFRRTTFPPFLFLMAISELSCDIIEFFPPEVARTKQVY